MSLKKLNDVASKLERKIAQQQSINRDPVEIPGSPFRTAAIQFFGDLHVNNLGFLFSNPTPAEAVNAVKTSQIEDEEIKNIVTRYKQKIQQEIDFLTQFRASADFLLKK
jgi:hypothetical protein